MLFGSNTLFIVGSQIWESMKIVISFGGQKENVSNKENSPSPIRDFINERSLKLTKILNLNLLKFDCQNLRSGTVSRHQN